jgi:hypothetical protein
MTLLSLIVYSDSVSVKPVLGKLYKPLWYIYMDEVSITSHCKATMPVVPLKLHLHA